MAIRSIAGASLQKQHSVGSGSPVPVSFVSQSYCGWVKFPTIGPVRTLFSHDGLIILRITALGQIETEVNGVVNTGPTILPTNQWVFWCFDRTTGGVNNTSVCWVTCVSGVPALTTPTTEISATQALTGTPTAFTVFVPAGCSVCSFMYGGSTTNLIGQRTSWGATIGQSIFLWRTPLRFPDDLHDHRAVSASAGDTTFQGMHGWDTVTGTLTLDAIDPEHLQNQFCDAVLGVQAAVFTLAPTPTTIPALTTVEATAAVVFPIATTVMPATSVMSSISLDGYVTGDFPDVPFTLPTFGSRWTFTGGPGAFDYFASHGYALSFFGYYVWDTMWSGPNPNVNNPATGLPWTLTDLYTATFDVVGRWNNTTASSKEAAPIFSVELGLHVLYRGQITANTCGAVPSTGTIIVIKDVQPDDGTLFSFLAGLLTPSAFSLGDNDSIEYAGLIPGAGYSIEETVPAGWTVAYAVSNSSPVTNIAVAADEIVVVTVTNTPIVVPPVVPECPEQVSAGCWSDHDINTLAVELDGDYTT